MYISRGAKKCACMPRVYVNLVHFVYVGQRFHDEATYISSCRKVSCIPQAGVYVHMAVCEG